MSYLIAAPEYLVSVAAELLGIGSSLDVANLAAALPISEVMAAGADEVSTAVSALFAGQAQQYRAVTLQAEAFHQQFVRSLTAGADSYAAAEALNVGPLQPVLDLINAPTQTLLGRPLVGNGADATTPGGPGGPGGLLYGSGGKGAPGGTLQADRQRRQRRGRWVRQRESRKGWSRRCRRLALRRAGRCRLATP
ncbi:hypothetical protein A5645_15585 [Mycobacterium asiaticum]|uniref:PE family protein n=1 Tax=Mycobacterium asiaticum TaxID=1790 RepID=UPI0007F03EED|nr:PE family protein [Mycobacterium asiaticum]OBK94578.1 hypothetical protein A5645_15585 [Mycobacterium asiaticum]